MRGTLLLQHFPVVEAIVMTGIAGGVPNPDKADDHVRLGDVVVSGERGVIQYDFVKKTSKVNEVRASPRPPHPRLLEAVRLLEADALSGSRPWEKLAERAKHLEGAARPEGTWDVLHASRTPFEPVDHPVDRKRRAGQPRIFRGPVASGNVLMKDPVWRDKLREQHGAKAVEMEGSGVADATWEHARGYLVVRGICDYCDGFKNDDWHMYAAIVAAAYTRALLERMAGSEGGEDEVPEAVKAGGGTPSEPRKHGKTRSASRRATPLLAAVGGLAAIATLVVIEAVKGKTSANDQHQEPLGAPAALASAAPRPAPVPPADTTGAAPVPTQAQSSLPRPPNGSGGTAPWRPPPKKCCEPLHGNKCNCGSAPTCSDQNCSPLDSNP
jgi:nucleoside phosphorylase